MITSIPLPGATRGRGASSRLAALALGLAAGCSQGPKSDVPLVPASGKVTLDAKPLPGVVLEFIPAGETRGLGGSGRTDAEGAYSVTTPLGEPGLAAGSYQVVITKREVPGGAAAEPPSGKDDRPPASVPSKKFLPPEYSDPVKTTLKAAVPAVGLATNDFMLRTGRKR